MSTMRIPGSERGIASRPRGPCSPSYYSPRTHNNSRAPSHQRLSNGTVAPISHSFLITDKWTNISFAPFNQSRSYCSEYFTIRISLWPKARAKILELPILLIWAKLTERWLIYWTQNCENNLSERFFQPVELLLVVFRYLNDGILFGRFKDQSVNFRSECCQTDKGEKKIRVDSTAGSFGTYKLAGEQKETEEWKEYKWFADFKEFSINIFSSWLNRIYFLLTKQR